MDSKSKNWKSGINTFFPIPYYLNQADEWIIDDIQEELISVCDDIEWERRMHWRSDAHSLIPNAFNRNIIDEYDCKNFKSFLDDSIKAYVTPLIDNAPFSYAISASWLTKTEKGQYTSEHSHGSSDISGVYYIKTNGNDGKLGFNSPHQSSASNPLMCNIVYKHKIPLDVGVIALWPGYLSHDTDANQTDDTRISMSFNIVLGKGGIDSETLLRARI